MRHKMAGNRLNRNPNWRKATIRDLAKATLIAQRICTTKARAKEARKLIDRLISMGKSGTLADKRRAFAILSDHNLVSDLFNKTAPRFKSRLGGYTRIIHLGARRGDGAQLAYLELTEKAEVKIKKPKAAAAQKIADSRSSKEEKASVIKETPGAEAKESFKEPIKEQSKKETIKVQNLKSAPQDKPGKNILGNIRKMFNRKTGGGN